MSSYVVLARKWRPSQFSDIVGQQHIVRTLSNAITRDRIHHAYLFTGSRGIGKTSIARIFAKALRCENRIGDQSCNTCSNCYEITHGNSVDVIEIDGASNNGVDAIRELRENAQYTPSTGKRKIFIIDEVHMLTHAAFNALLKTLEEPPTHVLFIFATTEAHKIPVTVLSRCQRFDYRRVSVPQIQARLEWIATQENLQLDSNAATALARSAEGSMRDALSLLDQAIAFSDQHVTLQTVQEAIGHVSHTLILTILKGILKKEPAIALNAIEQADEQGYDFRILTHTLSEFLHECLLVQLNLPQSSTSTLSEPEWMELKNLAPLRTLEELELIFQVLHHGIEWISRSPQPKIVLDVLVIKCSTADALAYSTTTQQYDQPPQPSAQRTPPPQPTPLATEPIAPPIESIALPDKSWDGFIQHVRKSRPLLASILEHGSPAGTPPQPITLFFSPQEIYFRDQLQTRLYQEQLHQLSKEYFNATLQLTIELKTTGESVAAKKERTQKERFLEIQRQAQNHPTLLEAKALFGGELGQINLIEGHHANPIS